MNWNVSAAAVTVPMMMVAGSVPQTVINVPPVRVPKLLRRVVLVTLSLERWLNTMRVTVVTTVQVVTFSMAPPRPRVRPMRIGSRTGRVSVPIVGNLRPLPATTVTGTVR